MQESNLDPAHVAKLQRDVATLICGSLHMDLSRDPTLLSSTFQRVSKGALCLRRAIGRQPQARTSECRGSFSKSFSILLKRNERTLERNDQSIAYLSRARTTVGSAGASLDS